MVTKEKKKKGHPLFRCIFGSKLLHRSQNNAKLGGLLQRKKKKKKRSSPVLLHFYHHFWPKYVTKRRANQVGTCFVFFGDVIAVTNFSDKYKDTFSNCPKPLQPAMRHFKPCNAPNLAQCATFGHPCLKASHLLCNF